mmetsp:Transcript_76841/g.237321  ORF Transcript_76841/g.237321 Transcript_76841/m.237321 type:complete len:275 (-) Transcript_76841:303-1127(-)
MEGFQLLHLLKSGPEPLVFNHLGPTRLDEGHADLPQSPAASSYAVAQRCPARRRKGAPLQLQDLQWWWPLRVCQRQSQLIQHTLPAVLEAVVAQAEAEADEGAGRGHKFSDQGRSDSCSGGRIVGREVPQTARAQPHLVLRRGVRAQRSPRREDPPTAGILPEALAATPADKAQHHHLRGGVCQRLSHARQRKGQEAARGRTGRGAGQRCRAPRAASAAIGGAAAAAATRRARAPQPGFSALQGGAACVAAGVSGGRRGREARAGRGGGRSCGR